MALELISTPRRDDTPIESDVAASISQLPYKFQRRDDTIVSSADDAGFLRVNTTNLSSIYVDVGQLVYIWGENLVVGVATILFIGIRYVTVNIPYTVDIGAGWINYINGTQGYKILLEPVDALTGESFLPYPEDYTTKQDGTLFVSASALMAIVRTQGVAINYRLRYHEYYDGIINSTVTDLAVFAMAARKQLLDVGGSNMWEFLPNKPELAKSTTKFKNAVTWLGWSTYCYAVLDKDTLTRNGITQIGFLYTALDVNGEEITATGARIIPELPRLYQDELAPEIQGVEGAYYVGVQIYGDLGGDDFYSERILYKIKRPCANPIMLEWLNNNGVGEQWLFETMQDEVREALPGQTYEKPILDTLDNVNDTLSRLTIGSVQRIVLFADQLTPDQIRALHGIKESLWVWLWLDQTGEKKIKVVVEDLLTTNVNTRAVLGSYSCQIRLPRNFDFYKHE